MRARIQRGTNGKNGRLARNVPESKNRSHHSLPQAPPEPSDKKLLYKENRRRIRKEGYSSLKNALFDRGYIAFVQFSREDNCFFGKLEGIDDLIMFEGQSVEELKEAFHEAVDDYLELCKKYGQKPDKSYKGSFNVRIDPKLHRQAALKSAALGISLNKFVQAAIKKELR